MLGYDNSLQLLAADIDKDLVAHSGSAFDAGKADRTLAGLLQQLGFLALALVEPVGNHGTGGKPASLLAVLVDVHAGTDDTAVNQGDGNDLGGQVGLLEGTGAEAVVPLEHNKAWLSRVAEDLNELQGGSFRNGNKYLENRLYN